MSDGKQEGGDPRERPPNNAPIKRDEVVVTVKPKQDPVPNGANRGEKHRITRENADKKSRADKAAGDDKGGATKEVRDAVDKAAPGGREAQKKAAQDAATEVGKKLDRRVFDGVDVKIPGEKTISAPATEGPSPAEAPPPPAPKSKGI